jgi:hypothetical protein
MFASTRRLVACLLLVLLPLQVFASINTHSCAQTMPNCPSMQAGGDGCCKHGMPAHAAIDDGAQSGQNDHTHSDMSPCGGATSCAPVMSMAAQASAVLVVALPVGNSWLPPATESYLSFIPDGLHRPPCSLA